MMAALVTLGAWAGTDEVIVTRQLTLAQRKKLPEKTIQLDVKRVTMARKADTAFYNALVELLDTVAEADWSNRTFVVILDQRGDKVKIAIHSDDILTNAAQRDGYWGDLSTRTAATLCCSSTRRTSPCCNSTSSSRARCALCRNLSSSTSPRHRRPPASSPPGHPPRVSTSSPAPSMVKTNRLVVLKRK